MAKFFSFAESVERLKLRRRAVHALATALHQNNRVSEPLALQRRALAHALHTAGNPEAVSTLEPRVHIAALSIVRLYMLSEDGSEDLARVADRPDCCEGSWKTLYGRGRPGQNNRFFQPVVKRDNGAEISNVAVRVLFSFLFCFSFCVCLLLQNFLILIRVVVVGACCNVRNLILLCGSCSRFPWQFAILQCFHPSL